MAQRKDHPTATTIDGGPLRLPSPGKTGFRLQTFSSLRHRDYRLLWFGTVFASSGQWIQQVSVGWLTYDLTGSPFLLGVVNGFRSLPMLLLGPFGGVAADRMDRRRLMLFTQLFLMIVTAVFATAILEGYAQVWNIILFSLLTGIAWAFNMPVRQSVVPNLVPYEDLSNAVALNSAGFNVTRVVGPSLAGLLIAWFGAAGNFYLQSAAYLGVVAMVWMMRIPAVANARSQVSVWRNLVEGARYVWGHPTLRSQMSLALIPVVIALPYATLMPVFAQDVLRVGPEGFGILMAAPGLGALIGTLVIASLGNIRRKGLVLFASLLGVGTFLILFSQSRSYPLSLALLVLLGGFQMTYLAINQTLLQMTAPDEFRGRVMGIYLLNQGLLPLGSLFAGAVANSGGAPFALTVMGGSVLVLTVLAFMFMPSMRQV